MKSPIKTIITIALAVILLVSGGMLIQKHGDYKSGDISYNEAESLAGTQEIEEPEVPLSETPTAPEPEPEITPEPVIEEPYVWREAPVVGDAYMDVMAEVSLEELRETNVDVLGWISIPDTQINYPIMDGDDNSYYLNNTWDRKPSIVGSIFLECQNSSDLSDYNTLLYGHRMKNGSMFAALKYYDDAEYWREHPYVYIKDDYGVHRYEIFAAYEAAITSSTYRLGFDGESKQEFIDSALERSVIDTGVIPTINDRMLTLSTCTGRGYDTRWVVQARLEAAEN